MLAAAALLLIRRGPAWPLLHYAQRMHGVARTADYPSAVGRTAGRVRRKEEETSEVNEEVPKQPSGDGVFTANYFAASSPPPAHGRLPGPGDLIDAGCCRRSTPSSEARPVRPETRIATGAYSPCSRIASPLCRGDEALGPKVELTVRRRVGGGRCWMLDVTHIASHIVWQSLQVHDRHLAKCCICQLWSV